MAFCLCISRTAVFVASGLICAMFYGAALAAWYEHREKARRGR